MQTLTLNDLKPLLAQFTGEGMVLSCYADLGVSEGFRPDWRGALKAKADGLKKDLGGDEDAVHELRKNVAAVREALEVPALHAAGWAAVFSSTRRKFLHVVPLDVPVRTDLVLDRSPYLVPLLEAAIRRREYLVIQTDTGRGRVYAATPGEVRPLAEIHEEVPRHQHSAGETWGYSQATIARHRTDCISHFRKELTDEVVRLWDEGRYAGLILLGEHDVLEHFRHGLPPRMADRVVREETDVGSEPYSHREQKVRALVSALYAGEETGLTPELRDRLREGKAVATGPRAVIEAVQGGRIGPEGYGHLVFGPDPREVVGVCVACRSLSPDMTEPCPKCQAPCVPGNLWEELLLTALRHRIAVQFIKDPQVLAQYGGLVAVLPKAVAV